MTDRSMDTRDNYYDSDNNYPRKGGHVAQSSVSGDSVQSDDVYYFNEKNKKNHNNNHNENMEIENIEEGNEEEDGNDDDANSPKSGRGGPPSVLSYASMTPFYRKQPQTVFDFSTKLDIEFNNPMNEEGSVGSSRKGGSTKSGTFKKKEFGSPLNAPLSSAPISIKAIPDRMKSPQGSNKSGFNMNDGNNSNSVSAKKYFYNENNSHTEIDTMEAASDKNIEIIDFMDSVTNNSSRSKPISIRSANSSGKLSGRKEVAVENTFTPRDPFRTYGVPNPNNNHNQAGPESIMTGFDNINGNNGSNGNGNAISRFSPRGMNAEKGNNNTELFSVSAISSKKHNKGESELKDHQT